MGRFQSTKKIDGFSTCFRQWRAFHSHCKQIHGYSVSFVIYFEGDLDEKNWVFDFAGFKHAKEKIDGYSPNEWFKYMFDHTVIIAENDPEREWFEEGAQAGILNLRILPHIGAERFAEFVFYKINEFVKKETNHRVRVIKVECHEHDKNSASFSE